MNLFKFKEFNVLIDYAHNAHGMRAIGKFLSKVEAKRKIGVIAGVGDRRDEDLIEIGKEAAKMFDEIVIRQDRNMRGRDEKEIIDLMIKGIRSVDDKKVCHVIPIESEAIEFVIKKLAKKDDFIIICSDVVPDALEQIIKYKEEDVSGFGMM